MRAFSISLFIVSLLFTAGCTGGPRKPLSKEGKSPKFEWDFSQEKKFVYNYHQEVVNENLMDRDGPPRKMQMTGDGLLSVKVKSNQLADVILSDMVLESFEDQENGEKISDKINAPTNIAQDMQVDGSFGEQNVDMLFDILFPLPPADLSIGESHKIPMKLPFNANGSILFSKGFNTLFFKGHESFMGRNCAVLEGTLDISKLDIPDELDGEYKCSTVGKATYYFDTENQYFIGADIHFDMFVFMDTGPKESFLEEMYMNMTSDNTIEIRLDRIE